MDNQKKTVITAALPYANGSLHLGHMVEYIQADIYVRALKLTGQEVLFVCADDTHGAPIQIKALDLGITPEELIAMFGEEHKKDFADFGVAFDNYYTTNSPENKTLSEAFFSRLKEKDLIYTKEVEQLFDEEAGRFLPDRFIKGKCPKCGAMDQYGDVCEVCSSIYGPTDLVEPYSTLTRSTPVLRKSTHYFFTLSSLSDDLSTWIDGHPNLQEEVKNFVRNWIKEGLVDWCISRDEPYFGFEIPGSLVETGAKKYFYVWLDAPIGYISATQKYCQDHNQDWEDYWKKGDVIHFIGKDIVYFHLLFWPAMLKQMDYQLPSRVHVHGMLTVDGKKMSKSRGTFIMARKYLDHLDPELLRFYYASHLGNGIVDLNLDLDQFKEKINNELIGNVANLCNRTLSFITKNYDGVVCDLDVAVVKKEIDEMQELFDKVGVAYRTVNLREVVQGFLAVSAIGNKYFQENEPWKLIKEGDNESGISGKDQAHHIVSFCAAIIQNLSVLIQPIMPQFSLKLQKQLGVPLLLWKDLGFVTDDIVVGEVEPLVKKLEDEHKGLIVSGVVANGGGSVKKETNQRSTNGKRAKTGSSQPSCASEEGSGSTNGNDVDSTFPLLLKVGKILSVEDHPNADKLFVEKVDFGDETRTIISGIKEHYQKEDLVGKKVVVVVNLKHAKLRGVMSEGMILMTEHDGKIVVIEAPDVGLGTIVTVDPSIQAASLVSFEQIGKVLFVVKDGKILVEGKTLKAGDEEITVHVPDGAKVC
jgi:methionyl-tRNA synthetase